MIMKRNAAWTVAAVLLVARASFGVFSFNDLERVDLAPYKLFVFPGLFEVTPDTALFELVH